MRRFAARSQVLLAAVALTLAGCAPVPGSSGDSPADRAAARTATPTENPTDRRLPEGWRWEAFGGVQVGVPGAWGWGNASQRIEQWCIVDPGDIAEPIVGRPGPITLVGCPGEGEGPSPGALVRHTGEVVLLDRTDRADGTSREGDRTTVVLDHVAVTVQTASAALRARIVETVHAIEVDANGCPAQHRVSVEPGLRPEPTDLAELDDVSAVAACRYAVEHEGGPAAPRLVSSLRLQGAEAAAAVAGLAGAPEGGGPDTPSTCVKDYSYGDEVVVVRLVGPAGDRDHGKTREVVLRYSGCDHNGIDDGVTVRRLTRESVAPLLDGPNRPDTFSGPQEKVWILRGER